MVIHVSYPAPVIFCRTGLIQERLATLVLILKASLSRLVNLALLLLSSTSSSASPSRCDSDRRQRKAAIRLIE